MRRMDRTATDVLTRVLPSPSAVARSLCAIAHRKGPDLRAPRYSPETLPGFIVVEGLDGAGTSTQSELLRKRLRREGYNAELSAEPTNGPVGTLVRQIMRGRLNISADRLVTERQLAYLFAADRHDHLYNDVDGIAGLSARGIVAISTRYFFSSYAYNGRTMQAFDLVERLNADFPLPQAVVYLRVPVEVSLARLNKRDVREFYEHEDELRRVDAAFGSLFGAIRDRVVEVESVGDATEVSDRIAEGVLAILRK